MARDDAALTADREPGALVTISVFGGFRISRGQYEVHLGPPRQRVVLAKILAAGGNVVSVAELVDTLWGSDPPASAVNQVHRIAGQLRRTLEPGLSPHAAGNLLPATGAGYRIVVEPVRCDLFEFRRLVREADAKARSGAGPAAGDLYVEALTLAQGQLFGGLNATVAARPEFVAIENERIAAAIRAADLAHDPSTRSAALTAVLRVAATAQINEPLHARLIRLLGASGRRADGLAAFDTIRRRLADELGVSPGPELVHEFQQLLRADANDASTRQRRPRSVSTKPSTADRTLRPRQLPRPLPGFVERNEAAGLIAEHMAVMGATKVITVFGGMPGIGKSALAVHLAHQVADLFPDGQLYVDLRGFDQQGRVAPLVAVNAMVESLGHKPTDADAGDLDSRSAQFRTLMAGRKMIVLLDNARDSDHVRPLLPGSPNCLVLITSRNTLTGLVAREGAGFILLGRLNTADSLQLLTNRLGSARLMDEPEAVDAVIHGCGGLPLALALVAARLATEPNLSVTDVSVHALLPAQAGTGGEDVDDLTSIFSWSYEAVTVAAARVFRLLAVHPGPDFSLASIASLCGVSVAAAARSVKQLVEANLLEQVSEHRFRLHDLLALYGRQQLTDPVEENEAEQRVIDHFVGSTRAAGSLFGPRVGDLPALSSGVTTETFEDVAAALAWYRQERSTLVATIELALERRMVRHAVLLVLDWRGMNQMTDPVSATLDLMLRVASAATALGEPALEAELQRDLGARRWAHPATATDHFTRALQLFRTLSDVVGEANTLRNLSDLKSIVDDRPQALALARQSVDAARRSGQERALALSLSQLAMTLTALDRWSETIDVAMQALSIVRSEGITYMRATIEYLLANAYVESARAGDALNAARSGLAFVHVGGDAWLTCSLLLVLARAAWATSFADEAADACRRFQGLRPQLEPMLDGRHFTDRELHKMDAQIENVFALLRTR